MADEGAVFSRRTRLALLFGMLAVVGRIGYYIVTPLWIDHFSSTNSTNQSLSVDNATSSSHSVSVFFLMITQWSIATLVFGVALIVILVFRPDEIGQAERNFPKKYFVVIGVSQAISSLLFNFSLSGSRTPLYLQAILSNSNIPIQFTVRYFLLRKKPTKVKLICALVVVSAEFLCLLPSIFPQLDAHHGDTRDVSTGVERILWPLCFVGSQVPFAISNCIIEIGVQSRKSAGEDSNPGHVNLVYFVFFWCLVVTCTISAFFWADIIPGFGTSANIKEFGENFIFDLNCILAREHCSSLTALLGWSNYIFNIIGCVSFAGLMRFSEGANFVIIVLTLRTPFLFIFWTLFRENPFGWHPEAHISTWLSVAGLVIMLPAIVIYDRTPSKASAPIVSETEDERNLLDDDPLCHVTNISEESRDINSSPD